MGRYHLDLSPNTEEQQIRKNPDEQIGDKFENNPFKNCKLNSKNPRLRRIRILEPTHQNPLLLIIYYTYIFYPFLSPMIHVIQWFSHLWLELQLFDMFMQNLKPQIRKKKKHNWGLRGCSAPAVFNRTWTKGGSCAVGDDPGFKPPWVFHGFSSWNGVALHGMGHCNGYWWCLKPGLNTPIWEKMRKVYITYI